MNKNKRARIDRLIRKTESHALDWILCTLPENIFYFSGFRTTFYTRFIGDIHVGMCLEYFLASLEMRFQLLTYNLKIFEK